MRSNTNPRTFKVQVVEQHQRHVGVNALQRLPDQPLRQLEDAAVGSSQEAWVGEVDRLRLGEVKGLGLGAEGVHHRDVPPHVDVVDGAQRVAKVPSEEPVCQLAEELVHRGVVVVVAGVDELGEAHPPVDLFARLGPRSQ